MSLEDSYLGVEYLSPADVSARARITITGATAKDFAIFAASSEYINDPSDVIFANQPFYGTLEQNFHFERSIISGQNIGEFTSGFGDLTFVNQDGAYDYLIRGFAVDGRRVVMRIGERTLPYSQHKVILNGTALGWFVERGRFRVEVQDNAHRLDTPVQLNLYGGTGGLDGTENLSGKRKPRCYGVVSNVSPAFVIPTELLYQVHDGSVYAIDAVYDLGLAMTFSANYATSAALRAASVPAGRYATCLAEGMFRIGAAPQGVITADVRGDSSGSGYSAMTADLVERTAMSVPTGDVAIELYRPSFVAVNAAQPAPVGIYLSPDDGTTARDFAARLMAGIGGYAGFRRDGKLEVQIFREPVGPPVMMIDGVDILEIDRSPLPSAWSPPPWRHRVVWGRNWTPQTSGLDSIVDATRRAFLSEAYRVETSEDSRIKDNHPLAQDPDPLESYFSVKADAKAEADRRLVLFERTWSLYNIVLGSEGYDLDLNQVILVTFPDWDLSFGRLLRVVSIVEDSERDRVEIVGFG